MTCTIQETPNPGVWSVTYEGTVTPSDRHQVFDIGRGVLEKRLASGILIDFRQAELHACEEDAYDLARERVSSSLLLGVRVALLFDRVPPAAEFEVLVAQNRGLEARVFSDEGEAVAWLASGSFNFGGNEIADSVTST